MTKTNFPTVTFETVTCARCAGSGTYPSAAWQGVCLGCSGKGIRFTPAGHRARLAYDEAMSAMLRTYGDVKPGDRVKASFGRVNNYASATKWLHVDTIKVHEKTFKHGDGEWQDTLSFTFRELDPEKYWGLQADRSHPIMIWDNDVFLVACRRVARLKGAIVTGLDIEADAQRIADRINAKDVTPAGRRNGRTATGSHAACDHETTPAARRRCRAARNA